jgi:NitT/TauT family transport system permease protein
MFTPNADVGGKVTKMIVFFQICMFILIWLTCSSPIIPNPIEIMKSFIDQWMNEGLASDMIVSFTLNLESLAISTIISLGLAYLTVLPFFRPIAVFISKLRFASMAGLVLIFTLATSGGHQLKLSLEVWGITVFFVTNMMSVVASVTKAEKDYARTLRMGEWQVLWETTILGKFDQAIDAIRQNAAIGWMMLTMVEGLARAEGGIGVLLLNSNKHFQNEVIFAIQLSVFMLALAQDGLIVWIKGQLCPYVRLALEGGK